MLPFKKRTAALKSVEHAPWNVWQRAQQLLSSTPYRVLPPSSYSCSFRAFSQVQFMYNTGRRDSPARAEEEGRREEVPAI